MTISNAYRNILEGVTISNPPGRRQNPGPGVGFYPHANLLSIIQCNSKFAGQTPKLGPLCRVLPSCESTNFNKEIREDMRSLKTACRHA